MAARASRSCFRRVKKMTMKTVDIPNTEPMTGPTTQVCESGFVGVELEVAAGRSVLVGVGEDVANAVWL